MNNLDDNVDMTGAGKVLENITIWAKDSVGYFEFEQHKAFL
jgi:hypothetical protein